MNYCSSPSQVICLQGFLFVLKGSRNISEHNSTNKTVSEDNNSVMKIQAFIWAMGLIATELVSVLLVAWSWSIICRLEHELIYRYFECGAPHFLGTELLWYRIQQNRAE